MSNERSPRGSWRTTIGTRGTGLILSRVRLLQPTGCALVATVACNLMVARDITLPVNQDEAWDALTDPELLAEWLGGEREAVLEEAEPGERLVFWWFEEGEPGSRVELTLAPVREGTRVSVREAPVGPFALAAA